MRHVAGLRRLVNAKAAAAGRLLRFVRWFRNWPEVWAASGGRQPWPMLLFRKGLALHHEPEDDALLLVEEIFWQQCYDRLGFYRPHPRHSVIDIGANIGVFALYLESNARGMGVHCFEPAADARARLVQDVAANQAAHCVQVHPVAVWGRRREAFLLRAGLTGDRSFFASQFTVEGVAEAVDCVSLSEALELSGVGHVDLLKVDVEGAEIEIFEDADPSVWRRVERVALEFHDVIRAGSRERVTEVLRKAGFNDIAVQTYGPDRAIGVLRAARRR